MDTVGITYRSIFQRKRRSAAGSNRTKALPYLESILGLVVETRALHRLVGRHDASHSCLVCRLIVDES